MKYLLILLLTSCVSLKTKMDQWLDQHESDLVTQWGLPDKETTSGYRKVYIYAKPIYAGTHGTQYRYTTFFIDHKGYIRAWNVKTMTTPIETVNIRLLIY